MQLEEVLTIQQVWLCSTYYRIESLWNDKIRIEHTNVMTRAMSNTLKKSIILEIRVNTGHHFTKRMIATQIEEILRIRK